MELKSKVESLENESLSVNRNFIVSRTISFYAMHALEERDTHIHEFIVTLSFSGRRSNFSNEFGKILLINYFDIDRLWKDCILSELVDSDKKIIIKNSTCETLAEWIFEKLLNHKSRFPNCSIYSVKVFDGDLIAEVLSE
jgi:6-pyruvoyl-tetrahydropterin synthase